MLRRLLVALLLLSISIGWSFGQIFPPAGGGGSGGGGAPTGAGGGELAGGYPNPEVIKMNGAALVVPAAPGNITSNSDSGSWTHTGAFNITGTAVVTGTFV